MFRQFLRKNLGWAWKKLIFSLRQPLIGPNPFVKLNQDRKLLELQSLNVVNHHA